MARGSLAVDMATGWGRGVSGGGAHAFGSGGGRAGYSTASAYGAGRSLGHGSQAGAAMAETESFARDFASAAGSSSNSRVSPGMRAAIAQRRGGSNIDLAAPRGTNVSSLGPGPMHTDGLSPAAAMHPDGLVPGSSPSKTVPSTGEFAIGPRQQPQGNQFNHPVQDTGFSRGFGTGAMIGASALIGGTSSYATGGGFFQGAVGGAAVGAGAGLGYRGAKSLARSSGTYGNKAVDAANSWISNSSSQRAAAFGSGALLGGMAFGGNRSHKRGFNKNRGNGFGR